MNKEKSEKSEKSSRDHSRPNFLFVMADELRFPPSYENLEIKKWRAENLVAQNKLRAEGFEFLNHYTGSTACAPARTTLFTGQYETLHGVTSTDGAAKSAFDPDMFWLDPNTVPIAGEYFAKSGYLTFYKGKWHISDEDILIPGTKNAYPSYYQSDGIPNPEATKTYKKANRLKKFGWEGWVGPEPHGQSSRNSGSSASTGLSGRDVVYTEEIIDLIQGLDKLHTENPWFMVASLVNPHDIALLGDLTSINPDFNFVIDPSVPFIPPAPTANEDLSTKPTCQADYKAKYQLGFQPTQDTNRYRQFYYSLNLTVDRNINRILEALEHSKFNENTVVVFTSDHGDYTGAHGLFQKWYTAYEEAIKIPLIIKVPKSANRGKSTDMLTSAVDVLPTLLGLAKINVDKVQLELTASHNEVHRLVGRDLSKLILNKGPILRANEPVLFITNDNVLKGPNQLSFAGTYYQSVVQPTSIQTVIVKVPTHLGEKLYKFSRYFDNPQFWSNPGFQDVISIPQQPGISPSPNLSVNMVTTITKSVPEADQFEMYNLTDDPYEQQNLASPAFATAQSAILQPLLLNVLKEQVTQKCLLPRSGVVPGSTNTIARDTHTGARPS
jgi:arylsulfatase A-like enzyme